ncbi:precorrin-6y C5,15-methyltransferase (decarboxylating) subunit CbiE [Anaeromicrobium sediminis]|uniref:Precorrin-6y C5,15-methyltransferase (Decarboxylating) subunit CbiE n=1 Tax=Anaeromicrobium sediminis TaxID=1478221 RepID=A0A267MPE5_9FIRM|nr:precorrin-6y C5,15-methyltransferase (decarboxylating) subunit CbiE [Anaeromicrobium sediminis]PAB60775.1 precorrin-6y C5,15-methyltransferase (decarboxylating) subunit CbiE [Anaeromicrobium sediminis]
MSKFYVLGMGPGNEKYILPITKEIISECHVLIGGKRNLQYFEHLNKEKLYISADLNKIVDYVKNNYKRKKICFLLSGDTGFYSMTTFIKKHFSKDDMIVIPGISSFQYMAAKIGEEYNDALLGSVHGRDFDYISKLKEYNKIFLLTDKKNSPKSIAKNLIENKMEDCLLAVGENLSYENEKITLGSPKNILDIDEFSMSVVMIKRHVEL